MEAVREKWTDERLDDLGKRVDDGFTDVDKRLDRLERRVDNGFARIDSRLDGISKTIMFAAVTLSGAMLTGFIALFTLVATRL